MNARRQPRAAIIDYGMGNLFSVANACRAAGFSSVISGERDEVLAADLIILPGVGAFGTAMERLNSLDLASPLRDAAASGRPLFGICLGMQLLMSESHEFGRHAGLDILPGTVERFDNPRENGTPLKVPHVGWNRIIPPGAPSRDWAETPLRQVTPGEYMYFVHSFRCIPKDASLIVSETLYGDVRFCSTIRKGNIFACQYHPERSGLPGLSVYEVLAASLCTGDSQRR